MSTTKERISEWIEEGISRGCTHMLVVCDTFEYDEFPVYVRPDEISQLVYERYEGQNMQRVLEIYDLKADIEAQIALNRAWSI